MNLKTLTAAEYRFWEKYYYDEFGWIIGPKTCKCRFTEKVEVKNNKIFCHEPNHNWDNIEKPHEFIEKYESNLTGIGLRVHPSSIVVIDFDDKTFYEYWLTVFKIKTLTSMTQKGFHVYLQVEKPFAKIVNTSYYDIMGIGCPNLPPSYHYKKIRGSKISEYDLKPTGTYKWSNNLKIAKIESICDTGLASKQIEKSGNTLFQLFNKKMIKKIKML